MYNAFVLPFLAPPVDYLLRHRVAENQALTYLVASQAGYGTARKHKTGINEKLVVAYSIGAPTPNGFIVKIEPRIQDFKLDSLKSDGMLRLPSFAPVVTQARLDTLNRLRFATSTPPYRTAPVALQDPSVVIVFTPFPAERVKIGSSWPVPYPGTRSTLKAWLLSVQNGIARIKIYGSIETPVVKESKPTQASRSTGRTTMDANVLLDVTTGDMVSAKATVDVENRVSAEGASVDNTGTCETTWEIAKR